jgi:hypothetical protein
MIMTWGGIDMLVKKRSKTPVAFVPHQKLANFDNAKIDLLIAELL